MKLSDLAAKAAKLPDCSAFDWPGPEQFCDSNFKKACATLPEAVDYVNELRKRMAEYSHALWGLGEAYRQMRDILLSFEIERE